MEDQEQGLAIPILLNESARQRIFRILNSIPSSSVNSRFTLASAACADFTPF